MKLPLQFRNEALELEKMGTFTLEDIKAKKAVSALKEATSGDVVTLLGKGLFSDEAKAKQLLAVDDDQLKAISTAELTVEIKEINERIPAELNQELFDKLYAPVQ